MLNHLAQNITTTQCEKTKITQVLNDPENKRDAHLVFMIHYLNNGDNVDDTSFVTLI